MWDKHAKRHNLAGSQLLTLLTWLSLSSLPAWMILWLQFESYWTLTLLMPAFKLFLPDHLHILHDHLLSSSVAEWAVTLQTIKIRETGGKVILTLQLSLMCLKSTGLTSLSVTKDRNKHSWDKYTELKANIIWGVNALLSTNFKIVIEKNEDSSKRPLKVPLRVQGVCLQKIPLR